jgi:peptidyl-tRNA hydrolase, PTH1 family
MVVDEVARRYGVTSWRRRDSADQARDALHDVVFVKPTSYMNLSGTPLRLISSWYRTPPQDILVVSDDMDLPFGKLRMRSNGGHGGHNGLRSVIATIGEGFPRLRIGVGRPEYDSIDHVLGPFSDAERSALPQLVAAAADGVERWLDEGVDPAMRYVNTWQLTDSRSESG